MLPGLQGSTRNEPAVCIQEQQHRTVLHGSSLVITCSAVDVKPLSPLYSLADKGFQTFHRVKDFWFSSRRRQDSISLACTWGRFQILIGLIKEFLFVKQVCTYPSHFGWFREGFQIFIGWRTSRFVQYTHNRMDFKYSSCFGLFLNDCWTEVSVWLLRLEGRQGGVWDAMTWCMESPSRAAAHLVETLITWLDTSTWRLHWHGDCSSDSPEYGRFSVDSCLSLTCPGSPTFFGQQTASASGSIEWCSEPGIATFCTHRGRESSFTWIQNFERFLFATHSPHETYYVLTDEDIDLACPRDLNHVCRVEKLILLSSWRSEQWVCMEEG